MSVHPAQVHKERESACVGGEGRREWKKHLSCLIQQ